MADPSLDAAWRRHVVAARGQSLEDAAATETASVAVLLGSEVDDALLAELEADAQSRGFATATVSLAEHSLHRLDDLLSAAAAGLRLYDVRGSRKHGLLAALEAFAAEHDIGHGNEQHHGKRLHSESRLHPVSFSRLLGPSDTLRSTPARHAGAEYPPRT